MEVPTYEIKSMRFGLYSSDEIMRMSVCKLDSSKHEGYGTVYDPRMVTTDQRKNCATCDELASVCTGHFGRIELNEAIIHPLFYPRVEHFLKCFCIKCHRLLITEEQVNLLQFTELENEARFNAMLIYFKKVDVFCREDCMANQPSYKFSTLDNTIIKCYIYNKEKISILMAVDEIAKVFNDIPPEDIVLLGFDPEMSHPSRLILTVLPVLPPCDRPYVKSDGNIGDDDLTVQYMEIIKQNNLLVSDKAKDPKKWAKALKSLQFRFATLLDNSNGKITHTTNSRPLKGIKERLTAKSGLLRGYMMGKRVDFSGRTVIGADPTRKFTELGVPEKMARILTVPVKVTKLNFTHMKELVNSGKVNYIETKSRNIDGKVSKINVSRMLEIYGTNLMSDDVIHRGDEQILVVTGKELLQPGDRIMRESEFIEGVKYPGKRTYDNLCIGDIVHRQLKTGDVVLINRQPTLHRESMQALYVVIHKFKVLKFNLAICKPFNADFDFSTQIS